MRRWSFSQRFLRHTFETLFIAFSARSSNMTAHTTFLDFSHFPASLKLCLQLPQYRLAALSKDVYSSSTFVGKRFHFKTCTYKAGLSCFVNISIPKMTFAVLELVSFFCLLPFVTIASRVCTGFLSFASKKTGSKTLFWESDYLLGDITKAFFFTDLKCDLAALHFRKRKIARFITL